jgi:hypothetical protein
MSTTPTPFWHWLVLFCASVSAAILGYTNWANIIDNRREHRDSTNDYVMLVAQIVWNACFTVILISTNFVPRTLLYLKG